MIRLGFPTVSIYPYSGVRFENRGKIIFEGKCNIGNLCSFAVGQNGVIRLGNNISATAAVKFICYENVIINDNTLIGWESIISDCDFHDIEINGKVQPKTLPIYIGKNNWFAMQCLVLKGAKTPDNSIFASRTLINKNYTAVPANTLFAGSPANPIKYNVSRKS